MGYSLKNKRVITVANAFQKTLGESDRKRKKIRIDKDSEFNNISMKLWLQDSGIKCIQHILKGNLLLLKNLAEP